MKHRIFLAALAILCVYLAGCSNEAPEPPDTGEVSTEAPAEAEIESILSRLEARVNSTSGALVAEGLIEQYPDELEKLIALGRDALPRLEEIAAGEDYPRNMLAKYAVIRINPEAYELHFTSPSGRYDVTAEFASYGFLAQPDSYRYNIRINDAESGAERYYSTFDYGNNIEPQVSWSPDEGCFVLVRLESTHTEVKEIVNLDADKKIPLPSKWELAGCFDTEIPADTYITVHSWRGGELILELVTGFGNMPRESFGCVRLNVSTDETVNRVTRVTAEELILEDYCEDYQIPAGVEPSELVSISENRRFAAVKLCDELLPSLFTTEIIDLESGERKALPDSKALERLLGIYLAGEQSCTSISAVSWSGSSVELEISDSRTETKLASVVYDLESESITSFETEFELRTLTSRSGRYTVTALLDTSDARGDSYRLSVTDTESGEEIAVSESTYGFETHSLAGQVRFSQSERYAAFLQGENAELPVAELIDLETSEPIPVPTLEDVQKLSEHPELGKAKLGFSQWDGEKLVLQLTVGGNAILDLLGSVTFDPAAKAIVSCDIPEPTVENEIYKLLTYFASIDNVNGDLREIIKAHRDKFDRLVELGREAMPYLTELSQGGDTRAEFAKLALAELELEYYCSFPSPDGKYRLEVRVRDLPDTETMPEYIQDTYRLTLYEVASGEALEGIADELAHDISFPLEYAVQWSDNSRYLTLSSAYKSAVSTWKIYDTAARAYVTLPTAETLKALVANPLIDSAVHQIVGWDGNKATVSLGIYHAGTRAVGTYICDLESGEVISFKMLTEAEEKRVGELLAALSEGFGDEDDLSDVIAANSDAWDELIDLGEKAAYELFEISHTYEYSLLERRLAFRAISIVAPELHDLVAESNPR